MRPSSQSPCQPSPVDVPYELASRLNLEATTFFASVIAAHERESSREVLLAALAELERMGLADEVFPDAPRQLELPSGLSYP